MNNNKTATISDLKEIQTIENAIRTAKKLDGIVDVANPQYTIQIGEESYFLWFQDQSATLINEQKTETIYKIENAGEINKIIRATL
ncbi:MAG TPA: hypothetical protein VNU45_11720 [Rummeliibacillus sp.]|nr:hypothetical protein [Rummeliibacillus sp.]